MNTPTGNAIDGFVDIFTSYTLGQLTGMILVFLIFAFIIGIIAFSIYRLQL